MKKFIKINYFLLLFIAVVTAQAPQAPGTQYSTTLSYLNLVRYGGSVELQSSAGNIRGSVILGQPVVKQEMTGDVYNASLGFYSYLLNVPDAPLVEAGDAESGGGITVSWKIDINRPVSDATET